MTRGCVLAGCPYTHNHTRTSREQMKGGYEKSACFVLVSQPSIVVGPVY